MTSMRTVGGLVAAILLSLATSAVARPGDLDPTFGTGGVVLPGPVEADEIVNDAIGTSTRWIAGTVLRGGNTFHLYVAKLGADGLPDPTFGTSGKAMLRWNQASQAAAIRQQADGKLVVVGSAWEGSITKMLVVRFNTDGSPDTTFGPSGNGTFTVNPSGYSSATALAIAPDGRIVVAGYGVSGSSDMVAFRLTSSGLLDLTFGTNGVKTIDFRGGLDNAFGVAVLASGKILLAGTGAQSAANANFDFAVVRLNDNGTVDTTFGPAGHNGLALYDVGGGYDSASAMALSGTSIVIGGTSMRTGQTVYELSALRLTADGARDAAFGTNGAAFVAFANSAFVNKVAVQSDGKLLLASTNRAVVRLTTAGVLDPAFGAGGIATEPDPLVYDMGPLIANADGTYMFFGSRSVAGTSKRNVAVTRYTTSGSRDASFGTAGIVSFNLFTMSWESRAVALGPTGKVYVAGLLYDTHDTDAGVMRFTAQGQVDTGISYPVGTVPFGASDDFANAVVVLEDGSAVIAGRMNLQGTCSFLLAKFNSNGSLDTANFGNIGRLTHTMGVGFAEALALVRQPDGKFVSAGYAIVGSGNYDFALARYTANGYLDSTFGTGGVVITPFGALRDIAQAVALQPDGKIVAAGYAQNGTFFDVAIARYNTDGSLDATFGTGGKMVVNTSSNNDQAAAVAITREGKIIVAGVHINAGNQNIVALRLNANGTLDTTFATSGIASIDVAGGADTGWGMALQRNGKILIAGQGITGPPNAMVAVRLNDNGTRDTSFGTNGVQVINSGPASAFARALAVQPDGRIVVAGTSGTNAAVVRLMGDPKKVTQADANNDGREDLYWRDSAGGLSWWLMDGAAATASNYQTLGVEWQLVDTGDFNGDGKADLVWRNLNDGTVYLWLLDGLTVTSPVSPGAPPLDYVLVGAADLDGDGKSDLVFRSTSTGQVYVWLMNGATIVTQGAVGNPGTDWKIVDLADFDGDGKADILWQRTTDGVVYTWWMNGLSIRFSFWIAQLDPALWTLVSAGDFNADGTADLLWRSTAGDTWVWLMDGMGGVTAASIGNPGGAWSIKSVADLDGDGRDDLVWRHTDGTIYYWKMNGTLVTSYTPITNPGGTWQIAAP